MQFARDNDGDGLIDSITTPSGSPSTKSDLDIYVPSNAKPGSNVSVTISTPTIPAITTTVKYTISDDGLTALPSDGSAPLPIVDGKFQHTKCPYLGSITLHLLEPLSRHQTRSPRQMAFAVGSLTLEF
ncbi:hypothetical protein QM027_07410 [Campylobacter concisus]